MAISRAAPLHPILVHFTIGLVGASFVFDVLGQWKHSASLATAGWWTIALAVPLTVATVVTGLISRRRVPIAEGPALRYLRVHTALGPIFFGCLLAIGVWRSSFWRAETAPSASYMSAVTLLVLLMTIQGYLGGELVYGFGVEVQQRYKRLSLHDS
ncbi:MAG TPA: DUF2231 domain-containing protein [Gemmatimonadaceae bacterium]|jgi:uncharacterized membrane protein